MASSSSSTPLASRHIPSSMSAPDLLADLDRGGSDDEEDAASIVTPVEPDQSWRPFRPPIGLVTPDRTPSPDPADGDVPDTANGAFERQPSVASYPAQPRLPSPHKSLNGSASPVRRLTCADVAGEDVDDTDREGDDALVGPKGPPDGRQLRRHASEPYRPPSPPFQNGEPDGRHHARFDREDTPNPHSDVDAASSLDDEPGSPSSNFASPPPSFGRRRLSSLSFSLWDYLHREVVAHDAPEASGHADFRAERISNFLNVPIAIEKIVFFGWVICFDAFLHTFTILPLRVAAALVSLVRSYLDLLWASISGAKQPSRRRLRVSHKVDLIKGLLLVTSCVILHRLTDASQMYHSVRGQETIKLYVIFNVLEVRPPSLSRPGAGRGADFCCPRSRTASAVLSARTCSTLSSRRRPLDVGSTARNRTSDQHFCSH